MQTLIFVGVKLHDKVHPQVLKIQGINKYDAKIQTLERLRFNPIRQRLSHEERSTLNLRKDQQIETRLRKQSNNNAVYLSQGVLGVMRLPLAQPVPYPDSRRSQVPSYHNTRWRLLTNQANELENRQPMPCVDVQQQEWP